MSQPQRFPFRIEFPPDLPISVRAEEIVETIRKHPVLILAGETGSGKTTQIPKMCLAAGRGVNGKIACTQPRRVAALSISKRVAEEMDVEWGREVGCKIRFNDQTSPQTVVKFLTDGMLLAEVQSDPLLRSYDTIIIDEAHERSLNIDFLLGHLRTLRYKRPELKIIITSATIDTQAFSKAFDDAPIIEVSGRTYPVEVIYAPLDSLGSDAVEGDEATSKAEALHYIDGAVAAVERILDESDAGDVLVFMPAERDIRETQELLEGGVGRRCEIVPLFGRLSNADQQRVFSKTQRRKIVVATNIAETSLTLPGIRFVVDTGLARVSRYAPGSRTRRLPIEAISQSSADQRKGRSGRVAEGVCIRLYSEKDFNERPRFSQPEIQRANLADVILRMKAFGLGDIERFSFINMPAVKSIRAGYGLLEELGAIRTGDRDEGEPNWERELTPVGRELARLPVDPTVGRMILQAREEKCVREVIAVAAGLSIQDPRERPMEKQAQADAAHRRFLHPESDFMTLLNIWDAFHDSFERLSQAKLRRFCHEHFLSYTRLREWRDIHAQLLDVLKSRDDFRLSSAFDGLGNEAITPEKEAFGTPAYRAIHRSIVSGLLGGLAVRDDENGGYRATHDRRVSLFPGSTLYPRDERKGKSSGKSDTNARKGPRWIMAGEIMETSRLYARTCARLDPMWVLDIGRHVIRVSHSEPFWAQDSGRVMVKQKTRLYGLEIETKSVGYGKINPVEATEIFIREALVNDTLTRPLDFLTHNRRLRETIEVLLTRTRDSRFMNLDEGVYRFYARHLVDEAERNEDWEGVTCVAELVDLVRSRKAAEPKFLMMEEEDLRDPASPEPDIEAFPEVVELENRAMPLGYAYRPGQDDDGATISVSLGEAQKLSPLVLDWAVPGHVEAKVEHYLKGAPKEWRRHFVPLQETAKNVSALVLQRDRLLGRKERFAEALSMVLRERFSLPADPNVWADKPLPEHLVVRVRVVDADGRELGASRELGVIEEVIRKELGALSASVGESDPEAWRRARTRWERAESSEWVFGDVPGRVEVGLRSGVPILAFPGFKAGPAGVALRLFRSRDEALAVSRGGLERLLELHLKYELAWMQKDLKALRELGALPATLAPVESLQEQAYHSIKTWLCRCERIRGFDTFPESGAWILKTDFEGAVAQVKIEVRGIVSRLVDTLRELLQLRQSVLVHPQPPAGLLDEMGLLIGKEFLRNTPFDRLPHLTRYVRAMKVRADRWRQSPAKDAERVQLMAPYQVLLRSSKALEASFAPLRWLIEEYRVSLFAQEVGTAEPVSAAKLARALEVWKSGTTGVEPVRAEPSKPVPTPIRAPLPTGGKSTPIKSLSALDRLFPKS